MDVNEEIAKEYFEVVEKCMVNGNIQYGKYHSAIDLLAIDKNRTIQDIEVKWKSKIVIENSTRKQNGFQHIVNQLNNPNRNNAIKELLGKKPDKKVFVTTKHFFSKSKLNYWINEFKKKNITVIFFDDIVPKLIQNIKVEGKYDSPISQTIRMLKYFDYIPKKQ